MYHWTPCELHTHTRNSDGSFTVPELLQAAKDYGLGLIALTDHNTAAGCAGLTPELCGKTVQAIKGIEWTTFFGHMVVLGADRYVDWRFATVENIDEKLLEVKQAGGLAGVAHPFRVGSPICTGCYWDYHVTRWDLVDYMEIWSELSPAMAESNHRAIALWTSLLDKGYHIAATYGKDWHGLDTSGAPDACTYLGLETQDATPQAALDAIRCGRTHVSMAPAVDFTAAGSGTCGDTLPSAENTGFTVRLSMEQRKEIWGRHEITLKALRLVGNGGQTLVQTPLDEKLLDSYTAAVDTRAITWLRAEVDGTVNGAECTLAITSPIYFKSEEKK